ncbi:hypothetical protein OG948_46195 (plasmid) [Embleya sp. NBC_00888]|uniref:hypothetical protein n=1 Tax=Embleya sp. NBC_00888 TaxID=2975960 RepID=UPI0038703B51|nr:hypothetical protein OG948_46195 [Embleya sp. NBC_00888]
MGTLSLWRAETAGGEIIAARRRVGQDRSTHSGDPRAQIRRIGGDEDARGATSEAVVDAIRGTSALWAVRPGIDGNKSRGE